MKKISTMFFMFILIMSMCVTVLAIENQPSEVDSVPAENSEESIVAENDGSILPGGANVDNDSQIASPLDYWNTNGWPDDVSYAHETGGEIAGDDKTIIVDWEIGIVNATDERKREITEFFSDTCRITFHDAKYSHAEREKVLTEIEIEVKENHDTGFLYGLLIRNDEKIYIVVKDEDFDEYYTRYTERYGDIIFLQKESEAATVATMTDGIDAGMGIVINENAKQNKWLLPTLFCVLILITITTVMFLNRSRLIPVKQTAHGDIVTDTNFITRTQVINTVKDSSLTPRDDVLKDIYKKIEKR